MEDLIDSMLKDKNYRNSLNFEDLLSKSDQVLKLIDAMAVEIADFDSEEVEEKIKKVKKLWKIVTNEIAQVKVLFHDFKKLAPTSILTDIIRMNMKARRF